MGYRVHPSVGKGNPSVVRTFRTPCPPRPIFCALPLWPHSAPDQWGWGRRDFLPDDMCALRIPVAVPVFDREHPVPSVPPGGLCAHFGPRGRHDDQSPHGPHAALLVGMRAL
jgi:hypothetical protein